MEEEVEEVGWGREEGDGTLPAAAVSCTYENEL